MDPRWPRLKELFHALVELPESERSEALDHLAAEEPELHARLVALLESDRRLTPAGGEGAGATQAPGAGAAAGPAEDPLDLLGREVSHFRVTGVLGSGGMGVVYTAEDLALRRRVALKFGLPDDALDEASKERFLQEARAASSLDHENICTIHEAGETEDGRLFIAMPHYAGETLRERLAREGPLSRGEARAIIRDVLLGLEAAHRAGIVHRDLKPANLLLTSAGSTKILDFGLAEVGPSSRGTGGPTPGTLAYMSPEQLRGEGVDERADLWSAGAVLYEMLTGGPPFGRGDGAATVYAILNDDPVPPSDLGGDVDGDLDGLVAALLRKDRDPRCASATDALAALSVGDHPVAPQRRRAVLAAGSLAAIAVVIGGLASLGSARDQPSSASPPDHETPSMAVLPFADLSVVDHGYFADGVSEEILDALARIPGLRVPARASSFRVRDRGLSSREAAAFLGVTTLLEGDVRVTGDSVRVRARLVDAASGTRLWSHTFHGRREDVFAIQSEVAGSVAEALEIRMSASQSGSGPAPTGSVAAHDLHLRGLFHWNRRAAPDLERARRFFEEATRVDSTYARPLAGLALTHAVTIVSGWGAASDAASSLARVEAAAGRALALDSALAEAHAALAYAYHWNWRWDEAERAFRQAVTIGPGYATAHEWYGEHLVKMGRFDEGLAELRLAVALDPLSLVAHNDLGLGLGLAGRYPEAVAQLERTLAMDPGFPIPLFLLHRFHLLAGDVAASAEAGRRWAEMTGAADPEQIVLLARATMEPGLRPTAVAVLAQWERAPSPRWNEIAFYAAVLDDRERVLRALELGLEARAPMMAQVGVAPWLAPFRDDPRFQRIVAQMRFPR